MSLDSKYPWPHALLFRIEVARGHREQAVAAARQFLSAPVGEEEGEEVRLLMRYYLGEVPLDTLRSSWRWGNFDVCVRGYELGQEKGPVVESRAGTRWAIVVGVSRYADSRVPDLRYAAADAGKFYDWLVDPKGGGVAPVRVKKLVDKDATYENLREALFVWSKQALAEDLMVIYFAGHASPESPDAMENLYLLPFDVAYDKIGSKGFPMWDVETALRKSIKARKVVVIADACHAGGIGSGFVSVARDPRNLEAVPSRLTEGLQGLTKVNDGVAVLTASGAKQLSREGEQWGGGHGVFTHFLLKGLQGEADYNHDGKVTLGELIPYVSENVRRETKSAQSPEVAGKFDPALTLGK